MSQPSFVTHYMVRRPLRAAASRSLRIVSEPDARPCPPRRREAVAARPDAADAPAREPRGHRPSMSALRFG